MYIKTGNLFNDITILIQSPCLHGGVFSESCHDSEREKIERGARVEHIPGQGDVTASLPCIQVSRTDLMGRVAPKKETAERPWARPVVSDCHKMK
jgi:hypothetical protein